MAEFAKQARRLAGMLAAVAFIGAVRSEVQRQEAMASAEKVIGWASVDGGTTGGLGAYPVTAKDAKSLAKLADNDKPAIIEISGTIELSSPLKIGSNKSIIGRGAAAQIKGGGLRMSGVNNVIIRNIAISGAPDAIEIDSGSHHLWIDHCDLSKCEDGLIDIKRGADLITISWTRFHDHHKTCLIGHSDQADSEFKDKEHLRVTFHHNFFDGSKTRHPRVRFSGLVHVFNNYYLNNDYGVASTMDAAVLFEGNYLEDVSHPTHTQYGGSDPGRLVERHNFYLRSGKPNARGVVNPPDAYKYSLDSAVNIPGIIGRGAGVGKMEDR